MSTGDVTNSLFHVSSNSPDVWWSLPDGISERLPLPPGRWQRIEGAPHILLSGPVVFPESVSVLPPHGIMLTWFPLIRRFCPFPCGAVAFPPSPHLPLVAPPSLAVALGVAAVRPARSSHIGWEFTYPQTCCCDAWSVLLRCLVSAAAMPGQCCCHAWSVLLPCLVSAAAMPGQCCCHAWSVLLPCLVSAAAMPCQCRCDAWSVLLPCLVSVAAMPGQCCCHACAGLPYHCTIMLGA
ncbi:unnamed protein product [Closterium sp. NIES-54]